MIYSEFEDGPSNGLYFTVYATIQCQKGYHKRPRMLIYLSARARPALDPAINYK